MHYQKRPITCARQTGLTLVELMVAMLLGVVLSGGMVTAYITAKRNFFYDDQLARMQENGRYAMRLLSRELSMAGFFGGVPSLATVSPRSVSGDCSDHDWALDPVAPLEMVNDHAGQLAVVSLNDTPFTCLDGTSISLDTDLISIKRSAAHASLRRGVPAPGLTQSDIEKWYLRVTSGHTPHWEKLSANDLNDASRAVPAASYWEAVTRIFFIRRYSETGEEDGIPSLCMKALAGDQMTSRCLVEGVEDMQLEFGMDTDGDGTPDQYMQAPPGSDMQHAVTARIHLLLRSIRPITGYRDAKSYTLGRKNLPARRDAYLRRVFSSTIRLRNRIEPVG